ncbi:MAG TPA: hypothetical protein VHV52_12820 [Gaiellaceae bacterium]|jgi:uncharacterized protein involved in exopolysaccharide biosynthesis|nr:hypothetical protein [Gaiellaceae bacterium]
MTAPELDAEREVDLARWRRAVVALWWLPAAGLVLGAILGVLYSFHGTTNYQATALISLGQPTSPGGALVPSYGTNPRAVSQIVSGAKYQEQAADAADMHASALRGHVSVGTVGSAGAGATRTQPLISLTVTGAHGKNVAAAANVLAAIVVQHTTAAYVNTKIQTFQSTLNNVKTQLAEITSQLGIYNKALAEAQSKNIDPLQQLVIVGQQSNAETRQGNLIAQEETLQQQLVFAQQVEAAQIVEKAAAVKASAHSKSTSLVIGALIGLILGAILAIALEPRFRRGVAA